VLLHRGKGHSGLQEGAHSASDPFQRSGIQQGVLARDVAKIRGCLPRPKAARDTLQPLEILA
jgi:hypothetical protein